MKRLALLAALATSPALALDVDLAALLADPDTQIEAAIAACDLGVTDPKAADTALTSAGWEKAEGEFDGAHDYVSGDTWIMMYDDPGFCMASAALTTAEMWDALNALGLHALPTAVNAEGCDTADMGDGVTVTLSGPGNDPACTAQDGAALRFEASN